MVWEGSGPPGTVPGFWVHTWPAWVWEEAARAGIRCLPAPPQPPPPARYAHSGDPAWESADGDPEGYGDPVPRVTRVANVRREPYQVYVGRPGPWGNPFEIGRDGSRGEVIAKYAVWVRQQPALMARLGELRGRVLGCWCAPEPCHGDVLAALADGKPPASLLGADELLTAWQYADLGGMLVHDSSDLEFVRDLDRYGGYVAGRRRLPPQAEGLLPVSVWQDVAGAMVQRAAESGSTDLYDIDLDAVADGYLPAPEHRPGGRPSPAQFMAGYGEPPGWGQSIWSYGEPRGEQAYYDVFGNTGLNDEDITWRMDPYETTAWDTDWPSAARSRQSPARFMADANGYGPWFTAGFGGGCSGCCGVITEGDTIRADGSGGWLCTDCGEDEPPCEERDAGWGAGIAPWDGDDIRPY
jgi:hypothetical protein